MAKREPRWRRVKFGDVVRLNKETSKTPEADGLERYVGLEHIEPGDLRVRSWGDIVDGTTFTNRFRPGQVLFGKRRAYQRKVAVADFDGVCSGDIYVLETKDPRVLLPELLPFVCQTEGFFEHAVGTSAGSLSPRTNWNSLASYEFPLPPLNEQRRICQVLGAAEDFKRSAIDALEAGWRARIATYHRITHHESVYKTDSKPFSAPEGWFEASIGRVLRIQNNLRKPISKPVRAKMQGDYPYYGPTGQLDSLNEFRINGTFALLGEDGDHFLKWTQWSMTQLVSGRFNVNNHAHVISGTDTCSVEWFFHVYRHRDVRRWLTKQGAGRLKLKKSTLAKMPILVPPMAEQHRLIEMLNDVASADEALRRRVHQASELLNILAQRILEG